MRALAAAACLAGAACGDDAGPPPDALPDASPVGTSCALGACPEGLACVKLADGDPNAYCTAPCGGDPDCPADFFCGDDGGGARCLRRSLCSPCARDEQCRTILVPDGVCTADGFCSKACDPAGRTCPSGFSCDEVTLACVHGSGSCVSDGTTCDPCVIDADCAATGGICFRFLSSGEQLCAEPCNAQTPCAEPYQCDIPPGMLDGHCVPPVTYGGTCYPEPT